MRILYLHQFFMTRSGIGGTRSYEFARRFVQQGHQVTMVTAGDGGRRTEDGIEVVSVKAGYGDYVRATKLGYGRRGLEFARFAAAATRTVLGLPRPDVIYATSPPLTMALPALAASKRFRTPLVFEVRDLWPEAPIQMGALPNPALQRVARLLERTVYRGSAHVNALSPGHARRRGRGRRAGRTCLDDPQRLRPGHVRPRIWTARTCASGWGSGDRFVCSYFGTMGEANDLTQVVDAAPLAPDVAFVLHGDGKRREALMERARGVENVIFSEPIPDKSSVARLAAASDACMTIYKDVPILATCSPNKLFDTFAAGRPAVVNCDGWMRSLVEDNDAGVFVRPGDPADLAAQVQSLRGRTEEMGRNARALAEREFDRELLAGRMLEVLERVACEVTSLSYCIVNTNGAEYLPACVEAARAGPEGEVLVLDNASDDGSGESADIKLDRREGKAANDSRLLRQAQGEYCLLLNEDAELHPGAAAALVQALDDDPGAAAVGAQLVSTDGVPVPCAWRLPGVGPALAVATGTQKLLVTQSGGTRRREVGWCQSSAMLVRRSRGRAGRLPRPRLLRLLRRDRLLQAPARRRLAHPVRARGGGHAPQPAVERPRGRGPAAGRVPPQPRPLHAQAPHHRRAAADPGPVGGGLPGAGAGRLGPRPDAAPRPPRAGGRIGRGRPRGGRSAKRARHDRWVRWRHGGRRPGRRARSGRRAARP